MRRTPMAAMLEGDDVSAALFQWERAFERAMRALTLFGDHWETCLRNKGRPCDCGFTQERRELEKFRPT